MIISEGMQILLTVCLITQIVVVFVAMLAYGKPADQIRNNWNYFVLLNLLILVRRTMSYFRLTENLSFSYMWFEQLILLFVSVLTILFCLKGGRGKNGTHPNRT